MNRLMLALVALVPVPLAAQEAPPQPAVGYEDALACTFIATSMIIREDRSRDQKAAAGRLVTRYMDHAEKLSGKTQREVVNDMAKLSEQVLDEIEDSAHPRANVEERYLACEANAKLL